MIPKKSDSSVKINEIEEESPSIPLVFREDAVRGTWISFLFPPSIRAMSLS
jgi:hypothetical protein